MFQKTIQAKDISADGQEQGLIRGHTAYAEVAEGIVGHEVDFDPASALYQESDKV